MKFTLLGVLVALPVASSKSQAAPCPVTANNSTIDEHLGSAESALKEGDLDGLGQALEETALALPCLDEAVDVGQAARLHRMEGVRLYAVGGTNQARASLLAAKVLQPWYVFPESILPANHDLHLELARLRPATAQHQRVAKPKMGALLFDGLPSRNRPTNHPTIFQLMDPGQSVISTTYLLPDDPLPVYAPAPITRRTLAIIAGSSLLVGASLYGGSWASRSRIDADDPTLTRDDLKKFQSETNTLAGTSIAMLGVGAGVGVVALAWPKPKMVTQF